MGYYSDIGGCIVRWIKISWTREYDVLSVCIVPSFSATSVQPSQARLLSGQRPSAGDQCNKKGLLISFRVVPILLDPGKAGKLLAGRGAACRYKCRDKTGLE